MLIINNQPRSHTIGSHVTLLPGVNEVPPAVWGECKKIPLVAHYLREKHLEEKNVDSIRSMAPDAAIEMIKATGDLSLLDRWREGESRKKVIDALAVQRGIVVDSLKAAESENNT